MSEAAKIREALDPWDQGDVVRTTDMRIIVEAARALADSPTTVLWCKTHQQVVEYRAEPCDYNTDPSCEIVGARVVP